MNPHRLLQTFDRLAEAPDAIPRLRRFILDLAVRGKLVEQDPNDEPAAELLKRIKVDKEKLVAQGYLKKQKPMPEVGENDAPYALPEKWAWQRLGELANPQAGFAFKSSEFNEVGIGMPIIRIRDVGQSESRTFFDGEYRDEFVVHKEDYLVSMDGNFRVAKWVGADALLNQRVSRLQFLSRHLVKRFIALSLQFRLEELQGVKTYTTVDHLSGGQIASAVIGVPPLAEQHRIVAKVDELMALCDQLQPAQDEREARRDRLVAASLHQIQNPDDLTPVFLQNLPRLTTRPEHIKQLRQTILNLAVLGKLTLQNHGDGDARSALMRAFDERNVLVKKGALARKSLTNAAWLNDSPFSLPWQWVFASFDHLASPVPNALKAGPFGSALKKEFYVPAGYKIYGQEQVISQDANFGNYYISEQKFQALRSCEVKPGDLLISLVGTIGKVLILPPDSEAGIINPRLIKMSLNNEVIFPEYVRILLQAPWVREFLFAESHGTTMDVLNLTILRSLPIPVPPLAEQHRIVAKVDELMALCDQLEAQLTAAQTDSRRLLEAVLRDALSPALAEAA